MVKPHTAGGTTGASSDKGTLGAKGSNGAQRDRELLRQPCDVEAEDEQRLDRIRTEVDAGFDALRDVDDGVSIFGSARIAEGHR